MRIAAAPNPVPKGSGTGITKISWSTPRGGVVIRVSLDGTAPKLFAEGGATGSASAPFIVSGHSYTFKMYSAAAPKKAVASVVVTRS